MTARPPSAPDPRRGEARVIQAMPMAEYQALKALSAGGVHTLVKCPARYWHELAVGSGQW